MKITNATAMYAIMMLVFATGMWAILVYGSTLQAPIDLSGEWELAPEDDPQADLRHAIVEQSGRYVRLRIDDAEPIDLRMSRPAKSSRAAPNPQIVLTGESMTVIFEATLAPSVHRLSLLSPDGTARRFTARIVERTYPRPAANQPQNVAPASPELISASASTAPAKHAR